MSKIITIIFSLLIGNQLFSQDSILLLSGEIFPAKNIEIVENENLIKFQNKRGKEKNIELDYIFSVRNANGSENVIYKESVIEDENITIESMRSFVNGAYTARKQYRAPLATISGFVIGAGSVFAFPMVGAPIFYSPVLPAGYSAVIGSTNPCESRIVKRNPTAENDEYYIRGYKEMANQKRVSNTVKGGLLGIAASIIAIIILVK